MMQGADCPLFYILSTCESAGLFVVVVVVIVVAVVFVIAVVFVLVDVIVSYVLTDLWCSGGVVWGQRRVRFRIGGRSRVVRSRVRNPAPAKGGGRNFERRKPGTRPPP